ncbi:MAG: SDR family oxidoreductase [Acidaminococcaceae bacterium]
MNYGLQGRVVVISGGTSGIGLATARLCLADGARVYLVARQEQRGTAALAALAPLGGEVSFMSTDVSIAGDCRQLAVKLGQGGAGVDVLINAAGIYQEQRLETVTEADYTQLMDVNVKGTLFLSQALLPLMHSKDANIINVGSDAGLTGNYGCPLYCASKGAVVALTRALALDYAGRVRVNCVCPGDVATPMVAAQLATGNYTASELAAPYPVGRIGEPQEIAHMLCAIASPMNSFMTGAIIAIDGGLTAS